MNNNQIKELKRLAKQRREDLRMIEDLLKEGYDRETISLVLNESEGYVSDLMFELGV